jgi:hypothetical protein
VKGELANGVGIHDASHTTSEHGVSSITTADMHTSVASSRLNSSLIIVKLTLFEDSSHTTSEHGISSITTADMHTSVASSRLNSSLIIVKLTLFRNMYSRAIFVFVYAILLQFTRHNYSRPI